MIGTIFGRLTVISMAEPYISPTDKYEHPRYLCVCECGKTKIIRKSSLERGDSKSCGCLQKELARSRLMVHGHTGHELFTLWLDMNRRCYDATRKDYKHYGGRGIVVCDEWRGAEGFKMFVKQMYPTYVKGLEIDRTDVNGKYSPDNCKWASRREQVINRRYNEGIINARFVEFKGKRLCISQWADETGISASVISDRLCKLGWTIEKTLTTPIRKRVKLD